MTRTSRTTALGLTLAGCLVAVAAHLTVLRASGQDPVTTPVGLLSTAPLGSWQTAGILAFALAHVSLAWLLGHRSTGPMRQVARVALLLAGAALGYVALYFASADPAAFSGAGADDRLPVPASLVGAAMGLLLPGLWRTHRSAAWFAAAVFGAWLTLVGLALAVDPSWIGAYERMVAATYATWVGGIALFVGLGDGRQTPVT